MSIGLSIHGFSFTLSSSRETIWALKVEITVFLMRGQLFFQLADGGLEFSHAGAFLFDDLRRRATDKIGVAQA
jgi:hypothetical protein